jgi:hypothetical protein
MNQLLDAVALGQAVAFIPASVASRHAVPDLVGGFPVTRHRPLPPQRRRSRCLLASHA